MSRLSKTKKRKTHNYRCQMEEPRALEVLSAADEFAGGSSSSKRESRFHTCAHVFTRGGVRRREDRGMEACRSLVDAKVLPDDGYTRSQRTWWWGRRPKME